MDSHASNLRASRKFMASTNAMSRERDSEGVVRKAVIESRSRGWEMGKELRPCFQMQVSRRTTI